MVKAYLFDFDGTLVANEHLKAQAFADACRAFGGRADPGVYRHVLGTNMRTATDHFTRQAGISPRYDDFRECYERRYGELLEQGASLTAGAMELVHRAIGSGMGLAIVSSEARSVIERVLCRFGLIHSFDVIVSQGTASRSKPDPEPYLLALARLSLPGREVLAFEDSTAGLLSASRAGCPCIAVRHAYSTGQDTSLARRVISDFREILSGFAPSAAATGSPHD